MDAHSQNDNEQEKFEQLIFQSIQYLLEDGEEIETIIGIIHFKSPQAMVITDRKFIFAIPIKKEKAIAKYKPAQFSRYFVKKISYDDSGHIFQLHLAKDVISFQIDDLVSHERAKEWARKYKPTSIRSLSLKTFIKDLGILEKFYFIVLSAEEELKNIKKNHPKLTEFKRYIRNRKISHFTTAAMLASYMVLGFLYGLIEILSRNLDGVSLIESFFFLGFLGWLGYNLIKFKPNARLWVIISAMFPAIVALINLSSAPNNFSLISSLLFISSIWLVLLGKPRSIKIIFGGFLFLLTSIGPQLLQIVVFFIQ